MDLLERQDHLSTEYRQVLSQYREANDAMLRLAEDPESSADEFRKITTLVGVLSTRLRELRATGLGSDAGIRNEA